jgi:hypothetical protein
MPPDALRACWHALETVAGLSWIDTPAWRDGSLAVVPRAPDAVEVPPAAWSRETRAAVLLPWLLAAHALHTSAPGLGLRVPPRPVIDRHPGAALALHILPVDAPPTDDITLLAGLAASWLGGGSVPDPGDHAWASLLADRLGTEPAAAWIAWQAARQAGDQEAATQAVDTLARHLAPLPGPPKVPVPVGPDAPDGDAPTARWLQRVRRAGTLRTLEFAVLVVVIALAWLRLAL